MKIGKISPDPQNPRKITQEALERLKESIRRDASFMELRPIVVDASGVIIGGNQRYRAIKSLGMKEIPDTWVITADKLTSEQIDRFRIIDNSPEGMSGEFDFEMLLTKFQPVALENLGLILPDLEIKPMPAPRVDANEPSEDGDDYCELTEEDEQPPPLTRPEQLERQSYSIFVVLSPEMFIVWDRFKKGKSDKNAIMELLQEFQSKEEAE